MKLPRIKFRKGQLKPFKLPRIELYWYLGPSYHFEAKPICFDEMHEYNPNDINPVIVEPSNKPIIVLNRKRMEELGVRNVEDYFREELIKELEKNVRES